MARRVAESLVGPRVEMGTMVMSWGFVVERATGIEPA
jgi:hypothetical protein